MRGSRTPKSILGLLTPLFSTYTQGENRVTSMLLAVLEHVNTRLAEDILEALTDESDLLLAPFDNQVMIEPDVHNRLRSVELS
ncbi:hypothetical protein SAMN06265347_10166 [Halobellus salinus]|nr:hypothetical protein SAMN06265347_10166 [Halobellus salinus]